jgi:hypothetical protein
MEKLRDGAALKETEMGPSVFACRMAKRKFQKDIRDACVHVIIRLSCRFEEETLGAGPLGGTLSEASNINAEVLSSQGRVPRTGMIHAFLV